MPVVTALGEVLIDFTDAGISASGQKLFERNPGGAPANVLVASAGLSRQDAAVMLELIARETGISGGNIKIIPIN